MKVQGGRTHLIRVLCSLKLLPEIGIHLLLGVGNREALPATQLLFQHARFLQVAGVDQCLAFPWHEMEATDAMTSLYHRVRAAIEHALNDNYGWQ